MSFPILLFGTPGIPASTEPRNTVEGVAQAKKLGLGAMELEFVRNITVTEQLAPQVKKAAEENGIVLTCHGQYFVNLASLDPRVIESSVAKMVAAARMVNACGGWSITWHFAFNMGRASPVVYDIVKKQTQRIIKLVQDEGNPVWIRPETTGKPTQWGSLLETVQLSEDVEQVLPCIDFAHLHARTGGKNNTTEEWREMLSLVEKRLGRTALDNMHIQVSGVNYTAKGERNHLNLQESDLNWKELLLVWKEYKLKGVVITESPNIEEDTLMLKKEWEKLR